MLNPISAQIFCKNTKNILKSDFMDGFCLQGELDLTLFYKIEGHLSDTLRDILKTEILNDLNDRDLNDRKSLMTLNDTDP